MPAARGQSSARTPAPGPAAADHWPPPRRSDRQRTGTPVAAVGSPARRTPNRPKFQFLRTDYFYSNLQSTGIFLLPLLFIQLPCNQLNQWFNYHWTYAYHATTTRRTVLFWCKFTVLCKAVVCGQRYPVALCSLLLQQELHAVSQIALSLSPSFIPGAGLSKLNQVSLSHKAGTWPWGMQGTERSKEIL